MRRFTDRDGTTWDVVIGRESWGTLLALFVPTDGGHGAVRQAALRASAQDTAARELEEFSDAALQALLDTSTIKEEGGT